MLINNHWDHLLDDETDWSYPNVTKDYYNTLKFYSSLHVINFINTIMKID